MTQDIAIAWDIAAGAGDWHLDALADDLVVDEKGRSLVDEHAAALRDGLFAVVNGALVGDDLGTAILISLATDATAGADDAIPDGSDDPRGWWGDMGADRPIGSRLWLRMRGKQTDTVLARVRDDIERALSWLVDDGVAARVDVAASWVRAGMLGTVVTVHRTDGTTAAVKFDWAWGSA